MDIINDPDLIEVDFEEAIYDPTDYKPTYAVFMCIVSCGDCEPLAVFRRSNGAVDSRHVGHVKFINKRFVHPKEKDIKENMNAQKNTIGLV